MQHTENYIIMVTFTVQLEDKSLLPSLKKILSAIPGTKIIQHREKKGDSTLMTGEDLDAKIDRAHKELRDGNYTEFTDVKEMNRWLDTL